MKPVKIIVAFVLVLFLGTQLTNAQLRKIPSAVTESFKTKYGNASNVEWKDRVTSYSAIYELNGQKHEAFFDDDGSWKYTQTVIEETELPAAVNDGFQKSKYSEWNIERVERIEKNDNTTEYRIQVKKGDIRKKNLLFTSEGRLRKDKITV
jgi:hypothetical protein